ncbi:bacteriohemerythrin [Zoogloea sp.]|uniref:bacteriohemerythrin n=1 Tax=Zoogloea sp. TaxID=49181 RepID=UPI0011D35C45|nr:bacteriohemerythrin [Zoogloea sp.]MBK6655237.1 bacteriohemerythrin [Zoogloea sp.]TXG98983.1 MAG: bacteriohemerythrin [Zoogloea sp.]HOY02329.1 bacteriohemerythrin [Zoogloea sp.]HPI59301.1 bacteriohemerythrin [Zoogloea sp.]
MNNRERIAPFRWADYFETGFGEVDAQHRKLVDLVNVLAQRAATGGEIQPAELAHVLDGLGTYAAHHFTTEEALMERVGLDPRHVRAHRQSHADFVAQVEAMRGTADPTRAVPVLYRFVTSWLTFHILDTDQSMARQLREVERGATAEAAFEAAASHGSDPGNMALIAAVRNLLGLVAERNGELARINTSLEQRVAERTAELSTANQTLRQTLDSLQETRVRLLEADKLAAVGQLAAGVAHEINTPLGYVASNLGTLREYAERLLALADTAERLVSGGASADVWAAARSGTDLDFIREDLPTLVAESNRGLGQVSDIIHALQDFASPGPTETRELPSAKILEEAIHATSGSRRPGQALVRSYGALPALQGNPTLLVEAFKALLDNAFRALEGAVGTIVVRAMPRGESLVVEVEDDGCGMDEATRARIFEPFFTTRPVGEGRGLGLSSAYRIVLSHGGHLEVSSSPGKGSCFRVTLPLPAPR